VLELVDQGPNPIERSDFSFVDGAPSGDVISLPLLSRMRTGRADCAESTSYATHLRLSARRTGCLLDDAA
jgi:hypothetical protein